MIDLFSLTVSALGIVRAAVKSITTLIHEINAIRYALDIIASLRESVRTLRNPREQDESGQ
jgi:hypothetical protein